MNFANPSCASITKFAVIMLRLLVVSSIATAVAESVSFQTLTESMDYTSFAGQQDHVPTQQRIMVSDTTQMKRSKRSTSFLPDLKSMVLKRDGRENNFVTMEPVLVSDWPSEGYLHFFQQSISNFLCSSLTKCSSSKGDSSREVALSVTQAQQSNDQGMVYLDFYEHRDCLGDVTLSSGIRGGICMPAADYVKPPFEDDDHFYYKYPFKSLKVSNITESCEDFYITYFDDFNCTQPIDYNSVYKASNFTTCQNAESKGVSNIYSVIGNCTTDTTPQIKMNSYVISDYTGSDGCEDNELVSYTAYLVDSCFGAGNDSSTIFSCNSSESIHETQFYKSHNCTRMAGDYSQSDYTILGNTCNPVHTPNIPDDDQVAYTEFVGLQCLLVTGPGAIPSMEPTAMPTQPDLVYFSAEQTIEGIDYNTYETNTTLYDLTLTESIAACMTGVSASDVINFQVTDSGSADSVRSSRSSRSSSGSGQDPASRVGSFISAMTSTVTAAGAPTISLSYDVKVHESGETYDSLSGQLEAAVSGGQFNSYLADYTQQNQATGLVGASSNSVVTQNLLVSTGGSSSNNRLGPGALAGIVIACVVFIVAASACVYLWDRRRVTRQQLEQAHMTAHMRQSEMAGVVTYADSATGAAAGSDIEKAKAAAVAEAVPVPAHSQQDLSATQKAASAPSSSSTTSSNPMHYSN